MSWRRLFVALLLFGCARWTPPSAALNKPIVSTPSSPALPELFLRLVSTVKVSASEHAELRLVPDMDQDGLPEVLLASPDRESDTTRGLVISPGAGRLIACLADYLPPAQSGLGSAFDFAAYADGDKISDFVLGAPGRRKVALLSGASGRIVREWTSPLPGFGTSVALGPDADGDRLADVAVGTPAARQVALYSSQSGRLLRRWTSPLAGFGRAIAYRDVHGDGRGFLAVAGAGRVVILSATTDSIVGEITATPADDDWPESLSLDLDVTNDGVLDLLAATAFDNTIISGRDWTPLGMIDGIAVPDLTGDGQADWLVPRIVTAAGPSRVIALREGTPEKPALVAQWAMPPALGDLAINEMSFDATGRWLVAAHLANGAALDDASWELRLFQVAHDSSRSVPPSVEVTDRAQACPMLWDEVKPLSPQAEASLAPLLSQLATALTRLGSGQSSPSTRSAAAHALATIADPAAGLWWWDNLGAASTPTAHFPGGLPAVSQPTRIAMESGAGLLSGLLGQPAWRSHSVRHTRAVQHRLLIELGYAEETRMLAAVAKVPIELAVDSESPGCTPGQCETVTVYLTRRGERIYVAHVVYNDGSA